MPSVGNLNLSPTGTVSTEVGGVNVGVNPTNQNVGVSGGVGEGAVSVGYNPGTAQVGVNAQGYDVGDTEFGLGIGYGPAGITGGPSVIFDSDEPGARQGGVVGQTVGSTVGSFFGPVGSAVGSFVGSAVGSVAGGSFGKSKESQEHDARDQVRGAFNEAGVWEEDGTLLLPDGTVANFTLEGDDGAHDWTNPDSRTEEHSGRDFLMNYETDYTNDMDYAASMAGMTFARIVAGGSNKAVDQTGQAIGNQILGSVGTGSDFNEENFKNTMTNARAMYARQDINSKEDLLALANDMFSGDRIDDFDYAVMQQTAAMVFDEDFGMAQQLMGGRNNGAEVATQAPTEGVNRPGRIYSPVISAEEAFLSVKPFFDYYRENLSLEAQGYSPNVSQTATDVASGVGAAVATAKGVGEIIEGVTDATEALTGSKPLDIIQEGVDYVSDLLGPSSQEITTDYLTSDLF